MFTKLIICAITLQVVLSRPQDNEDEGRIVGGTPVSIENYAYQVAIQFPDYVNPGYIHKCGGGLISKNLVLTAAHCTEFSAQERADGKVHVGSADFWYDGEFINIIQIIDHPSYNPNVYWDYDISILELEKDVTISSTVQIISIASYPRQNGDIVSVAGWGRTIAADPNSGSQILLGAELEFIDSVTCRTQSRNGNSITDRMVCAGNLYSRFSSSCKGDSGGPLVHDGEVIGVVSGGIKDCGAPGYPRVFADVYTLRNWIFDQMRNYSH